MKTAILIEDGRLQLALTPESKTDDVLLRDLEGHLSRTARIKRGAFYEDSGTPFVSVAFDGYNRSSLVVCLAREDSPPEDARP